MVMSSAYKNANKMPLKGSSATAKYKNGLNAKINKKNQMFYLPQNKLNIKIHGGQKELSVMPTHVYTLNK